MHLSELNVYPVKSCRGIAVRSWPLDRFGLAYDRSFMVVDAAGTFLTQREFPRLALVATAIEGQTLTLSVPGGATLRLDLATASGDRRPVSVWDDAADALDQGAAAARFFSDHLGTPCRLVRTAPDHDRAADEDYAPPDTPVAFADGFPLLLIGAESLTELNGRLDRPLPMNRFRPNLVVSGSEPFAEDGWGRISVDGVPMDVVKPCARCTITTVDQRSGERDGGEPLRTLGTFRRGRRGVLFGQNLVHRSTGRLSVGDPVEVLTPRTT